MDMDKDLDFLFPDVEVSEEERRQEEIEERKRLKREIEYEKREKKLLQKFIKGYKTLIEPIGNVEIQHMFAEDVFYRLIEEKKRMKVYYCDCSSCMKESKRRFIRKFFKEAGGITNVMDRKASV